MIIIIQQNVKFEYTEYIKNVLTENTEYIQKELGENPITR